MTTLTAHDEQVAEQLARINAIPDDAQISITGRDLKRLESEIVKLQYELDRMVATCAALLMPKEQTTPINEAKGQA